MEKNIIAKLTVVLLIAFLLTGCTERATQSSGSMVPTIQPGESFIINTTAYLASNPRKWDIVAYYPDETKKIIFLGRIVALPGDQVFLTVNDLAINATPVNTINPNSNITYYPSTQTGQTRTGAFTLKPKEYYVLSDNSSVGTDSRHVGPIEEKLIRGKVVLKRAK